MTTRGRQRTRNLRRGGRPFAVLAMVAALALTALAATPHGPEIDRLSAPDSAPCAAAPAPAAPTFALQFGAEVSPYRLMSAFAPAGDELDLRVVLADRAPERFTACVQGVPLVPRAPGRWRLEVPAESGVTDVEIYDRAAGETMTLRVFTLEPYRGEGARGDFRFGAYERKPFRGLANYRPPRGFVRVEPGDEDLELSPNFRLGQFLSKQSSGYPKYTLVSTRLLLKLERLLEEVRAEGVPAETFTVMSAFRTPWYNEEIGNKTIFSRHLYGDAADIFIDLDDDGAMDDLDGNGTVDVDDARWLADVIERASRSAWYRPFVGGLGIYGPRAHRGPFVHIDTRAYRARWEQP